MTIYLFDNETLFRAKDGNIYIIKGNPDNSYIILNAENRTPVSIDKINISTIDPNGNIKIAKASTFINVIVKDNSKQSKYKAKQKRRVIKMKQKRSK